MNCDRNAYVQVEEWLQRQRLSTYRLRSSYKRGDECKNQCEEGVPGRKNFHEMRRDERFDLLEGDALDEAGL